jgi:hypothetical protein
LDVSLRHWRIRQERRCKCQSRNKPVSHRDQRVHTTARDRPSKSQFSMAHPDDWHLLPHRGKLFVREPQMASFSERMGITPPKAIQHQSLDIALRNSLWNVCYQHWFTPTAHSGALAEDEMYQLAVSLQKYFYKQPVNMLTDSAGILCIST